MKKKWTLVSWNVNGIRAVERKNSLNWLHPSKYQVVCFQETKVSDPAVLSEGLTKPAGYKSYWNGSLTKKGYSGVASYCHRSSEEVKTDFGPKSLLSRQGRTMQLDFGDFILINAYFPNGKASPERLAYKMEYYKQFLVYIKKLDQQGHNIIFCGDVNTAHREIDLARPKANEHTSGFLKSERNWIDQVIAAGFYDTLRMFHSEGGLYSWWDLKSHARDRNVGWRIDYFFVNRRFKKNVKEAFMLSDVLGSDHCPVGIKIEI